jgi:hypothetical protein
MHHFATYFDVGYLPRGLALAESLRTVGADFHLHVLCLDDEVYRRLSSPLRPEVTPWRLMELESADQELIATKPTRSRVEYLFTAGPAFLRHVLEQRADVPMLTYLDADMLFLADPQILFEEAGDASVILVDHRFPPRLGHLAELHGRYNVAWVSFRRDEAGMGCLNRWRSECIDWCYDRVDDGRFADQKYRDAYPKAFPGVHVLRHLGADVAPWNCEEPPLTTVDGRFGVGGEPIVFFHFQGLREIGRRVYDLGLEVYGVRPTPALRRLYSRYISALLQAAGSASLPTSRTRDVSRLRRAQLVLRGLVRRQISVRVGERLL